MLRSPCALMKVAPLNRQFKVDVRSLQAHVLLALEPVNLLLLHFAELLPLRHRIGFIGESRAEDEILVFFEAHAGFLRAALGREQRTDPLHLALSRAAHPRRQPRLPRRLNLLQPLGIDVGHGARVGERRAADVNVRVIVVERLRRVEPRYLIVIRQPREFTGERVVGQHQRGIAARFDHLLVDRADERQRHHVAEDTDPLAGLHVGRVVDKNVCQIINPRIAHGKPFQ